MRNLDVLKQKKSEIMVKMHQAITSGDESGFKQSFEEFTDMLQEAVLSEAQGYVQSSDNNILTGRGVRVLTSEENAFYQKVIDGMKSGNFKQTLSEYDVILPKTVIDSVFEDIAEAHPLLDAINFIAAGALVEILVSIQDGRHLATWDTLTAEITKELTAGFSKIDLSQKKLSAFIPISKSMLDLGPTWIDRYVRAILSEAIANGLEKAIIDGNGLNQPCGMRRNPNSALDPSTGYAVLTKVPVTAFSPENYGGILASLAVGPNNLYRTISEVLLIVNPVDYFTKIMPATIFQKPDGSYVTNIFPFPTRLIQSVWVPSNEAIIGIGKRYFMALGTSNGKGGKIEYSDEYRFLEDERMYLTKLYGNGKPLDSTSFKLLNITDLKPAYPIVKTTPLVDATLASLTMGAVEISPAFNSAVHYYTAATTNATNTVTATAKDPGSVITAKLNNVTANLGSALTWVAGINVVEITITNSGTKETYVLAVTKS